VEDIILARLPIGMFVGPLPHWNRRRPESSTSFFGFQYKKRVNNWSPSCGGIYKV